MCCFTANKGWLWSFVSIYFLVCVVALVVGVFVVDVVDLVYICFVLYFFFVVVLCVLFCARQVECLASLQRQAPSDDYSTTSKSRPTPAITHLRAGAFDFKKKPTT